MGASHPESKKTSTIIKEDHLDPLSFSIINCDGEKVTLKKSELNHLARELGISIDELPGASKEVASWEGAGVWKTSEQIQAEFKAEWDAANIAREAIKVASSARARARARATAVGGAISKYDDYDYDYNYNYNYDYDSSGSDSYDEYEYDGPRQAEEDRRRVYARERERAKAEQALVRRLARGGSAQRY
jgi:hypothetical protein